MTALTETGLDVLLLEGISYEISVEVKRAHAKHGSESMVSPTADLAKRLGILGEEFGEVCRATTYDNGDANNLREELIQVGAMALSWVYAIEIATADEALRKENSN